MNECVDRQYLEDLWNRTLAEDGVERDITCRIALKQSAAGTAQLRARRAGVLSGRVLLDMIADLYADRLTVDAKLNDGVLRLTLPKVEEAKPRQIEIKSG